MKRLNVISLSILSIVFIMSSCVRNDIDLSDNQTIDAVNVPSDFDWSTIKSAQLTVIPADNYNSQYFYLVEVYGENPLINSAAPLLAKGVAKGNDHFVTNLVIPTYTTEVFVKQIDPAKNVILQSVPVSGESMVCNFNQTSEVLSASAKSAIPTLKMAKSEVQNPTPAVVTELSANSNDVGWENNVNYLIPENVTFTKSIQLGSNSCLYIEGTYSLPNGKSLSMANGGKIVIQSGGMLQVSSDVNLNFYAGQIINYGSLIANGKFDLNSSATVYNSGTMSFVNLTATNSTNVITNDGVINATSMSVQSNPFTNNGAFNAGVFEAATNCNLINNGTVISGELDAKSKSIIYNNCHIKVNTLMDVHGTSYYGYNGSLLDTKLLVSDGTTYELSDQTMIDAETAEFTTYRNYIRGVGTSYALARFGKVDSYKNSVAKNITYGGKLEIECSDHLGNEKNNPFWVVEDNSAVRWAEQGKSTTNIDASDCNAGGNVIKDPSDPGTPSDPEFPILVKLTTDYSFIMEDNWPWLGDYDLNDLVVDLSISYLQNSDNKATEMTVGYKLRAVGASKHIAAGFRLDKITSDQVSSVAFQKSVLTGLVFKTENGGLESGQSKAVIPLFDDAHLLLNPSIVGTSLLNTIIGGEYFEPVSDTIRIVFASPIDPSDISIKNINFFIVTNAVAGSATRTEVHLSGYEPTDKADMTLFGTAADYSVNGAKYRTADNLIWGMLIPVSFNYASEWKDITGVYPQFAEWCTSGGVKSPYWYEYPTTKTGYLFSK
mgnify:CR=1 FL=1